MLTTPQQCHVTLTREIFPKTSLAYTQWGDENAERSVICMHGLTRNGRDFDPLAATLAQRGYRVFCPDMVGRGESSWFEEPHFYNYPVYAALMHQFIAELRLEKVDWVGTSMGGIIAMMLCATTDKPLLNRLVLNDIGRYVPASGLNRIMDYVGHAGPFATLDAIHKELASRLSAYGVPAEYWPHLQKHNVMLRENGYWLRYDPLIAEPMQPVSADVDLSNWWNATHTVPTLLIHGAKSDILTANTAQEMQNDHPDLTLFTVDEAGHAPALMSENEIEAITNFLDAN